MQMKKILKVICMTPKEKMLQAIKEMPDDKSIEDAMERFLLLARIERGIKQADLGETISHQAVRDRMSEWLN